MSQYIVFEGSKIAQQYAEDSGLNIRYYFSALEHTPFRFVAEKLPHLLALFSRRVQENLSGLNLIIEDSYSIDAYEYGSQIVLTTGLFEHLWLSSFLHYSFYLQTPFGNPQIDDSPREIVWTEEMKACARRLLSLPNEKRAGRPEILPTPTAEYDVSSGNIADLATEMALHSYMCILLHEVKHYIDFQNGIFSDSTISIEAAADNYAIESFMQIPNLVELNEQKRDNAYKKRILALIEMGAFLSFYELLSNDEDPTHPNGIYRIHNVLKKQSNIFDFIDDNNPNIHNLYTDIKPLIQYAMLVLNLDASITLPEHSETKQKLDSMLLNNDYEHTLSCYKELVFFLSNNIIEIHNEQRQHASIMRLRTVINATQNMPLMRF